VDPALIALAFAASTLPAWLAWVPGGELLGASQLGLALTAWVALAGVPNRAPAERVWISAAFALPPLALAAALDLRGGAPLAQVAPAWLEGVAMIVVLVIASHGASGVTSKVTPYEGAWLALVIAPVCVRFALDFGLGADAAPPAIAQLARWSPLGWALEQCTSSNGPHEHAWRPAIVVVGLCALAAQGRRAREVRA
jgi:hypothetical protein